MDPVLRFAQPEINPGTEVCSSCIHTYVFIWPTNPNNFLRSNSAVGLVKHEAILTDQIVFMVQNNC
jgi:hypothetical protein